MTVYVVSRISPTSTAILGVFATWEHATRRWQAFRDLEQRDDVSYSVEQFEVLGEGGSGE